MTKQDAQIQKFKSALELLNIQIQLAESYQDLNNELQTFYKFFSQSANHKNNRPNKVLMGFINYLNHASDKKRSVQNIQKQSKIKAKKLSHKLTYKDYIPDYFILRKRGHSYQSIANYSNEHFKIKVSKETIRKVLKELEDVAPESK